MTEDDLADMYAAEVAPSMTAESESRISEMVDPVADERFASLSLVELVASGGGPDLVGALMVRLGEVRAALVGHGGAVVVDNAEIVMLANGVDTVELQINLDGACVACGAAPGTLQGIQNDLLMDDEVSAVRFSASMLDYFDELTKEFLQVHGNVTFV